MLVWIFSLQFLILISPQNYRLQANYHLHVLEKGLYVLQEVRSIIIHPLSLRSRGNETSFAFTYYIIVSGKFCNVTFL